MGQLRTTYGVASLSIGLIGGVLCLGTARAQRAETPAIPFAEPDPNANASPQPPPIGTSHPISLVAAAPNRRWAVICQARKNTDGEPGIDVVSGRHGGAYGDAMKLYLVVGQGAGTPIDEYLDHDPSGRFVVLRRGKRHLLWDAETGERTHLPIARTMLKEGGLSPSAARFAPQGGYLIYRRRKGRSDVAVVRELDGGAEHVVDHGPGRLWDFGFGRHSDWLHLRVIARDADGDGRLGPPTRYTNHAPGLCGHATSYSHFQREADPIEERIVPLAGGTRHVLDKRTRTLGPHLLRWDEGWRWLETADGQRTPLVPGGCEALEVLASPPYPRVLAVCQIDGGPEQLTYFAPGAAPRVHPQPPPERRNLSVTDGRLRYVDKGQWMDIVTGRPVKVDARRPTHEYGPIVVVLRDHSLLLENLDTGEVTPLHKPYYADYVTAVAKHDLLIAAGLLIDRRAGKLLGDAPYARVTAVSSDGYLLMPDPGNERQSLEHMATRFAIGPLRWHRPKPDKSGLVRKGQSKASDTPPRAPTKARGPAHGAE